MIENSRLLLMLTVSFWDIFICVSLNISKERHLLFPRYWSKRSNRRKPSQPCVVRVKKYSRGWLWGVLEMCPTRCFAFGRSKLGLIESSVYRSLCPLESKISPWSSYWFSMNMLPTRTGYAECFLCGVPFCRSFVRLLALTRFTSECHHFVVAELGHNDRNCGLFSHLLRETRSCLKACFLSVHYAPPLETSQSITVLFVYPSATSIKRPWNRRCVPFPSGGATPEGLLA